jgi:hypothetical protein
MPQDENKDCYCNRSKKIISQGDIIRELNLVLSSKIDNIGDFSLASSFSYGVVLSQECDLVQHYDCIEKNLMIEESKKSDDKIIETLLICPAFPLEKFLIGDHIEGKRMNPWGTTEKVMKKIRDNDELPRFHHIPALKDRLPELVIDFKRFYTVPLGIFDNDFNKFYITSIKDLYRERLSQRFTNYLGRIGLPN